MKDQYTTVASVQGLWVGYQILMVFNLFVINSKLYILYELFKNLELRSSKQILSNWKEKARIMKRHKKDCAEKQSSYPAYLFV
jgi:hypothetical protein